MNAFDSLVDRVGYISKQMFKEQTASEKALRNAWLEKYKTDVLQTKFETESFRDYQLDLTGRLFPYIHNELLANSSGYIGRFARITHLTFVPLYQEKFYDEHRHEPDPLKQMHKTTSETLAHIWKNAIYPAKTLPDGLLRYFYTADELKTFRGGKAYINDFVKNIFDFSEPFITPKRQIIEVKDAIKKNLESRAPLAFAATWKHELRVALGGPGKRATDSIEFWTAKSASDRVHVKWRRHNRPYQTFTVVHDTASTGDPLDDRNTFLDREDWFRKLTSEPPQGRDTDPFARTALHDVEYRLFDQVMGRYLQGANYLLIPVELFLALPSREVPERTGFDELRKLIKGQEEAPGASRNSATAALPDIVTKCEAWIKNRSRSNINSPRLGLVIDAIRRDKTLSYRFDQLIVEQVKTFLGESFRAPELRFEFVAAKYMGGRAYAFSDLRNYRTDSKVLEDATVRAPDSAINVDSIDRLFTRTLILDCGMNGFERGRLIQTMSEFATERSLALQWLPRFRLVHHALNFIEAQLSLAVANFHNGKDQRDSVVPHFYPSRHDDSDDESGTLKSERELIEAMEFLSSCLTILNDAIEGGIFDRSSTTTASNDLLHKKLDTVSEERVPGFQTPREFILRRFLPPIRTIERTGERYNRLRTRISEVVSLVNANLQIHQRDHHAREAKRQTQLQRTAEVFASFAVLYYVSELLKHQCEWLTGGAHEFCKANEWKIHGGIYGFCFLLFGAYWSSTIKRWLLNGLAWLRAL